MNVHFAKTLLTLVVIYIILRKNLGAPRTAEGWPWDSGSSTTKSKLTVNVENVKKRVVQNESIKTTVVKSGADAINTLDISGAQIYCQGELVNQNASATAIVKLDMSEEDITTFADDLEMEIKNDAKQNMTASTEAGGWGSGDVNVDVDNEFNTKFKDESFKKKVVKKMTDLQSQANAGNNLTLSDVVIDPCGQKGINENLANIPPAIYKMFLDSKKTGACDCPVMTQTAWSEALVDSVLRDVFSDSTDTSQKIKQETTVETTVEATVGGIASIIDSVGKAASGFVDSVGGAVSGTLLAAMAPLIVGVIVFGIVAAVVMSAKAKKGGGMPGGMPPQMARMASKVMG